MKPAIAASFLAERHRWPLWLPVALGAGTGFYFTLPVEPSLAAAGIAALVFLAAAIGAFRSDSPWMRFSLALLAALALGFANAKAREIRVAAPVVGHTIATHLTGRVVALDWGRAGLRAVLDEVRSGRLPDPPSRIRVLVRKGEENLRIGQGVDLTAQLTPPPGPAAPGDSDFARAAFFARIGAVGFAYGAARPAPVAQPASPWQSVAGFVEEMRAHITARIRAQLPESTGAIASAIITGERGGIDPDDEAALRDAGLAHVLAIAGLHMALVGAGLFWLVRAMLALFPAIALNYPIKKWAAGVALAGAGFYLLISGASSSATRAFVMLAMMLVAILLDRPALSMRSLASAAAILLLFRPEAITEPGFQMSFASVASLIAVAEWEQGRERTHSRLYRYLKGIALTSLVASLATLPFAMFYFGRATHYAVLGNLLAMPVMGLVVMPMAALSVIAMPFGLEHWPLQGLGWGIDLALALGRAVAHLPGAVTLTPAFAPAALILIGLGGLWVVIWRRPWRWWGVTLKLAGIVVAFIASPNPALMVAADARTVALRGGDGQFYFPLPPKDRFAAQRWLVRDGDNRSWRDAVNSSPVSCDGLGCIAHQNGLVIALAARPEALDEDCGRADIIVSAAPILSCSGPGLVLGEKQIASGGGYAVSFAPLRAISVNQMRGNRPWVLPADQ